MRRLLNEAATPLSGKLVRRKSSAILRFLPTRFRLILTDQAPFGPYEGSAVLQMAGRLFVIIENRRTTLTVRNSISLPVDVGD